MTAITNGSSPASGEGAGRRGCASSPRARERFRRTKLGVLIPAAVTFAVTGPFIVLLSGHHLLNANPGSTKAPSSDRPAACHRGPPSLSRVPPTPGARGQSPGLLGAWASACRATARIGVLREQAGPPDASGNDVAGPRPSVALSCEQRERSPQRRGELWSGQLRREDGVRSLSAHAATAVLPSGAGPVLVTRMGAQTLRIVPPTNGVVAVAGARPLQASPGLAPTVERTPSAVVGRVPVYGEFVHGSLGPAEAFAVVV